MVSSAEKGFFLALLTCQNTAHTLLMRYSKGVLKQGYSNAVAVICTEALKMCVSAFLISRAVDAASKSKRAQDVEIGSSSERASIVGSEESSHPYTRASLFGKMQWLLQNSLVMAVPAGIYFIQNSLAFVALSNLTSGVFVVLAQMKILMAGLFSVVMLGRTLSARKWRALGLLVMGVILIKGYQRPSCDVDPQEEAKSNSMVGFMASIAMSTLSGFAGIYFEKVIKSRQPVAGEPVLGIWERNFQLAFWSIAFGFLNLLTRESEHLWTKGFWYDMDNLVAWSVVCIAGAGGLLVAVVVKHLNTIIKGFATTGSIVLASIIGYMFMGDELDLVFVVGASVVIMAVFNYNDSAGDKQNQPIKQAASSPK